MGMFAKLRCKFFGHPVPGELGKFVAPIRNRESSVDLPFLESCCPRCRASVQMHFLPGSRGMDSPAHFEAIMRWKIAKTE